MDLPTTNRLYQAAIAAARFADQRLESRKRSDNSSSLRRFSAFCKSGGYPDPLKERFVELSGVVAAYISLLATPNSAQWPAEKLRAALIWHYTKPEMLAGGHPHDRWVVETSPDGTPAPRGNPARSAAITQTLAGSASKEARADSKACVPDVPVDADEGHYILGVEFDVQRNHAAVVFCGLFSQLLWYVPYQRSLAHEEGRHSAWSQTKIARE
ncbi:hypothetical protein GN958_ATG22809 [Phytophthora infestans]|uniref:Uncharacterized protein n=1 Tax=Phytophthora infestans TaxID=4787 RepID=A0A8S9TIS4_PHYIN|nr:hypothetical protein GN958_ATG22809 [Phytophthora infestans]